MGNRIFFLLQMCLIHLAAFIGTAFSQSWNVEHVGSLYSYWDDALGIAVQGNYSYVATSLTGLRVVDVSNPANPVEVGYYDPHGDFRSVTVSENYAYAADYYYFDIFNCSQALPVEDKNQQRIPNRFILHPSYPNPFNRSTIISFELPKKSKVKLYAYDIIGNEIAVLAQRDYETGSYEVVWDAALIPSGVYFIRLSAGDFQQTQKAVVLK